MDILKPLIALLAIVNPIGVLPFFIHFTEGFTREQGDERLQDVHRRGGSGSAFRGGAPLSSASARR